MVRIVPIVALAAALGLAACSSGGSGGSSKGGGSGKLPGGLDSFSFDKETTTTAAGGTGPTTPGATTPGATTPAATTTTGPPASPQQRAICASVPDGQLSALGLGGAKGSAVPIGPSVVNCTWTDRSDPTHQLELQLQQPEHGNDFTWQTAHTAFDTYWVGTAGKHVPELGPDAYVAYTRNGKPALDVGYAQASCIVAATLDTTDQTVVHASSTQAALVAVVNTIRAHC
jgi:hypothetical protein